MHISIVFTMLNHMTFSGMRLAVALDAIRMETSPALVGTITALFAFLPMLGSVLMGRYIDRRGSAGITLICTSLLAGVAMLAAFLPHLAVLALAGLVTGGAYISMHIVNQQSVGRYSKPGNRPASFALSATAFAASSAIAPLATGFAIDHTGYRWTYIMLAALPLISMLFIFSGRLKVLAPRVQQSRAAETGSVLDLLRNDKLRRIYMINVLFATSWDVFLFMSPLYGASLNISASQIGMIIATFSSATFAVRLFAGPLSRVLTPWQLLLVSMTLNGVASLAFGLVALVPLMMMFAFTMGLGHGLANPMMSTLLYEASPPNRIAEVTGLRTSVSMGLQFALPMAAGSLGALIGIAPLFWLVASMQLAGSYSARKNWQLARP